MISSFRCFQFVQEGRRNTIFFMYIIETCAFFWNFRENVNVLKNSLLKISNSIFIDWKLTKYQNLYCHIWYANFSFVVQQIRHKFEIQKVDKIEEKRQRNSYLSFRVTYIWSEFPIASVVQVAGCRVCNLNLNNKQLLSPNDLFNNYLP